MQHKIKPNGVEKTFGESELIVSRTDLKGMITYCNEIFIRTTGYSEKELLGKQHSIVRHPGMPSCIFKLIWNYISNNKEIFAYIKNICKNGDYYWVFAHITPSHDKDGKIIGYHSSCRKSNQESVSVIEGLYDNLLKEESKYNNRDEGTKASFDMLVKILEEKGMAYDELILSV